MTTSAIQTVREKTGAGVMECKRALEEAGGNIEKALEIIHAKGLARAESKQTRSTGAGFIVSHIHNGRVGVLMELRTETDFAVKSEQFQELAL